ncbi:type II toxin-antitoxin system RelE/ParE family toxin [Methylosinus sp. PW1]|uniref:type II toxin-antitoxin system RelE/ParE family toxin n=1 Tax=Methylosinus sp. PW1 TaxID=107636 RepID=UPI000689E2D8|nr:type II toxin-antitoxin system RelE/ParE family toxin [Methylosinus sp. PW1]
MTETAEADLAEIWAYIAEDSEEAARRLIDKIMTTLARAQDFPMSGAARDQLARGLRAMFQGNYALYYMFTETEVILVRVLHGARDAAAIAEQGGFSFP